MQSIFRPFVKKSGVLFLLIFLVSFSSYSQTPTIPTPQQINDLLPNISPTQMTKSNLDNYLKDKNQSQDTKVGVDMNKKTDQNNRRDNKTLDKDSTQVDFIKKGAYSPEQTYGANIFQHSAILNVNELSTPPLDYPIGVGDHIVVALWGGGEIQEDYVVAKDGAIFPTGLGKITVQGLTFETARSIIYSRFRSVIPETTNIQITLGQPRTISVNVGGEVNNPGPVNVSAFSNAFNVIAMAGGVTDYGNLREIQVKRAGRIIETLDVYKYLTSGDIGSRVYLQNNDFVLVTFYEKKVFATGQFKRPMYYQLKKSEGIKALVKYSGGFNAEALTSGVKVIRTENEKQVIHDVNATAIIKLDNQDYQLLDGDIIKVDLVKPGIINKVELKGELAYPGIYELRPHDRLFDVINRAGGITKNTVVARAYIFRGAGDSTNIKSDRLEVNLMDFNKNDFGSQYNIELQPNDQVQFFAKSDFQEQQYVEIFGEIRKEGKYRKYGGMTLQDLLYLCGGLKQSAEFGRLEISSIVDMDSAQKGLKPTRTLVKSYAVPSNLELDSESQKIMLKPFDQVFVRRNPTFEHQTNITISGLVKYEGIYSRLTKNERLSSYIDRAGGLLENANVGGAILYRRKTDFFREKIVNKNKLDSMGRPMKDSILQNLEEPVSIDLYKAMKYRGSKHDIVLQHTDNIFIPEINPFVTVLGKVQSPLRITFDKEHTNLSYYIDKAGGFGIRPWRKRVFVTYANGRSKRTRNLFFMHFYPKVEEGSTITVPARPDGKEITDALVQSLITSVPIIITTIVLQKVK